MLTRGVIACNFALLMVYTQQQILCSPRVLVALEKQASAAEAKIGVGRFGLLHAFGRPPTKWYHYRGIF